MPELPEVETVGRGLATALIGDRIARAIVRRGDLRRPLPEGFGQGLTGARVDAIDRHAKYLLVRLDRGLIWLIHLGMSGRMVLTSTAEALDPSPHDHVIVESDGGVRVTFNDARRFGLMDLFPADRVGDHPLLNATGPEPLGGGFDADYLLAAAEGRTSPLKAFLLDQKVVAGLGNIYVAEALYRARLSPRRRAGTLGRRRAERLVEAIRAVLTDAIEAGGSTLRDYVQSSGELGYFQHRFAVYGKEGQPCPDCHCVVEKTGGIARIVQSNRSTFFCPRLQH